MLNTIVFIVFFLIAALSVSCLIAILVGKVLWPIAHFSLYGFWPKKKTVRQALRDNHW